MQSRTHFKGFSVARHRGFIVIYPAEANHGFSGRQQISCLEGIYMNLFPSRRARSVLSTSEQKRAGKPFEEELLSRATYYLFSQVPRDHPFQPTV
jgi:hypothetical protein